LHLPRHPIQSLRYRLPRRQPRGGIPKSTLKRYLPEDAVILEAGAHRGTDTVVFAGMWPDGQVHAFEPIPEVYEHLERATAALPNVKTYRCALGERTAVERMYVSGGGQDASSSLLAPRDHLSAYPEITFDETQEVEVMTIAAWASRERIERVDGMWLDMQGAELAALRAAGPILETTRAIILEVFLVPLYAGAPLWPEVREWLTAQGFRVKREALGESYGDALVIRD
jgi:FkbM family methyltransferase